MLQKVAAMMNKVAADLCIMASKARLLLHKKFFEFAASSAACLLLDDNDLLLEKQHQQLARQSYAEQSFNRREIRTPLPRSRNFSIYYRDAESSAFLCFCAEDWGF